MKARIPVCMTVLVAAAVSACGDSAMEPQVPFEPLAEISVDFDGGSRALFTSLTLYVGFIEDAYGYEPDLMILDSIPISATDVGREETFSAADGPTFDQVAARLTDGIDDFIDVQIEHGGGGAGRTAPESVWIDGGLSGTLDPDFAGFDIGRITFVIDVVSFDSPGEDPNSDGLWTDYSLHVRIVVEGRPAAP